MEGIRIRIGVARDEITSVIGKTLKEMYAMLPMTRTASQQDDD